MLLLVAGRVAQIDEDDYEAVQRYPWTFDGRYPPTLIGKRPRRRKLRLHEFLLGPAPHGLEWDHENRDPLDCRRSNLRALPHRANAQNSRIQQGHRPNTSGVRGVFWDKRRNCWRAYISTDGKQYHVGSFASIVEAANARAAAEQRFLVPTICAELLEGGK